MNMNMKIQSEQMLW